MAVIELARKAKGCRSSGTKSDLRVYVTCEKRSGRFSLGIRVSESSMKRLRWLIGDHVSASFDDEANTWSLRRVADRKGNALSGQGKSGGSGTVRFAIERSQLASLGLDSGEGKDAMLVSTEGECALFKIV